jgi:hypothetical protein
MTGAPPVDVVLVGSHADVATQPFEAGWGRVRATQPGAADANDAQVAVFLDPGLERPPVASAKHVVWHPAANGAGEALVVARPWPVADDLFEMPAGACEGACLVLTADAARAEPVVQRLEERGLRVRVATSATRELLSDARIVVSLTPELPAETFAVLAAGRLLVGPVTDRTCGLQAWVDYVPFAHEDELVQIVDSLAAYPNSWAPIRALGRQSADAHRASRAIGRVIRRVI